MADTRRWQDIALNPVRPVRWPALTVRNPWAWACLHGKPVENRTWEMKHRGPLWLHAGSRARWDPAGQASPLVRRALTDWVTANHPDGANSNWLLRRDNPFIAFGAVTALVEVTGCHHARDCAGPAWVGNDFRDVLCSPWAAWGQWHIELANVRPLPEPVPCRGMLGLWHLPEGVEKAVCEQLSIGEPGTGAAVGNVPGPAGEAGSPARLKHRDGSATRGSESSS